MPVDQSRRGNTGLLIAAAIAAAMTIIVLWMTALPLGIPEEWVWERLPADAQTAVNLVLAGIGAALYLGFVIVGDRRLSVSTVSMYESAAWLIGLAVAGFGWIWTVQETAPLAGQLGKAPFVLFYPGSSGYFTHARHQSPDANQLLRGYEQVMRQGNVLHEGTHPPGLILVFQGLMALIDAQPGMIPILRASEPESVRDAFEVIAENSARSSQPLTRSDRAVIWLAALLAMTAAAMTVWPLYFLMRATCDRSVAWIAAAAWPAVPATSLFLPKSDAVFPLVACVALVVLMASIQRRSLWRGVLAGFVLFLGLFTSLAFLPIMLLGGLCTIVIGVRRAGLRQGLFDVAPTIVGVVIGLLVPVLILQFRWGLNMLTVWAWNYHNHAGFYGQFTRTYWKWLLVNPVELTFALGAPLALAAVWGLARHGRRRKESTADVLALIAFGVWALLWLSGKNAGEAARLWVLFMPGAVWIAANAWQADSSRPVARWVWLALQMVASIATVHRVAGFHFG